MVVCFALDTIQYNTYKYNTECQSREKVTFLLGTCLRGRNVSRHSTSTCTEKRQITNNHRKTYDGVLINILSVCRVIVFLARSAYTKQMRSYRIYRRMNTCKRTDARAAYASQTIIQMHINTFRRRSCVFFLSILHRSEMTNSLRCDAIQWVVFFGVL